MKTKLSKARKNLRLLLMHLNENYKRISDAFDMHHYRSDKDEYAKKYYNKDDCGSIGCLLGYAPECLPAIEADYFADCLGVKSLQFSRYGERIFPELNQGELNFLFSSDWANHDNTLQGAINRITHFLDNPSDDYSFLYSCRLLKTL
jgi:hypothetical protein